MNYSLCPACLHFNPAVASVCSACGASLQDTPRTELPQLPELVVSDPDWQSGSVPKRAQQAAPELTPAMAKAAHRAAVRRNLMASAGPKPFPTFAPRDVLVLDPDTGEREQLSRMLDGFGFCAIPARDIDEAREMLAARQFAAVFLDIVLDGGYQNAEAELCRQVKQVPPHGGRRPALIIVSDRARSVDRVRATLAGVDGFLVKPAKRGDVVRALDESGVPLPSDSRRA